MKTKTLAKIAIFIALGLALHSIMPGFLGSMKPDPLLSMMFVSLILVDSPLQALTVGLAFGIASALTTTFPGGQIPNIIDKLVTSISIYFLYRTFKKRIPFYINFITCSVLGTLISGTVFLISAQLIVGLPAGFTALFTLVVLPACLVNSLLCLVISISFSRTPLLKANID